MSPSDDTAVPSPTLPRPTTDALTSFLGLPRRRVADVLAKVLQLPDGHTLAWFDARSDAGRAGGLAVAVGTPEGRELRFELAEPGAVARPWARGGGLVAILLPSDRDGVFQPADIARVRRHVMQRLAGLDRPEHRALVDELRAALGEVRRYRGLNDTAYRQIGAASDGAPYGFLRLGFRCNQRCAMCWQQHDWPDAPEGYPERWLDEMAAAGVRDVSFTGGEPTLYPGLTTLVERAARTHGMTVALQTNALRLGRGDLAARLVAAGLTEVLVSFHGATPEVSDAMTGAPGTFAPTVAGIEAALRAGLRVSMNAIVERRSLSTLTLHARTVVERFVRPFPGNPLSKVDYSHPCRYADADEWARAVVPFDEVRGPLAEATRMLSEAGVEVGLVGSCGWPDCVVADLPLPERRPQRDDLDAQDLAGRVFLPPCEGCAARGSCLGVRREYADVHGARGLSRL